jgi:hypothetical protein
MNMQTCECYRPGRCNATGEIYEVGFSYVVDVDNPRVVKFFSPPPGDKDLAQLWKEHEAFIKRERLAMLNKGRKAARRAAVVEVDAEEEETEPEAEEEGGGKKKAARPRKAKGRGMAKPPKATAETEPAE